MNHSFDIRIAEKYGIQPAIILNHLYFWIEKNRANKQNFHDGYYWTYNSKKAFAELFPYMTERQIDYAIKKLIDGGLVITGNYNEIAYDRTLWYAITPRGYAILQNCEMEKTELSNGNDTIVKPIPDINTDINTNINKERKKEETENSKEEVAITSKSDTPRTFDEIIDSHTDNEQLRSELKEHLRTRKKKKASLTNRAIELSLKELDKLADTDEEKILIVQNSIMGGYSKFYKLKKDEASRLSESNFDVDEFEKYLIDKYKK